MSTVVLSTSHTIGLGQCYHKVSAASTNAVSIKAIGAVVGYARFSNASAAAKFVKLYDLAAAPTVGTDVPKMTVIVPAGASVELAPGTAGLRFNVGLALAMTAGIADTDVAAVALNDLSVDIWYA
jgi:hypothetical protein